MQGLCSPCLLVSLTISCWSKSDTFKTWMLLSATVCFTKWVHNLCKSLPLLFIRVEWMFQETCLPLVAECFFQRNLCCLLETPFMLLGLMLNHALSLYLVVQTKSVWSLRVKEKNQSPQNAVDFVVVIALQRFSCSFIHIRLKWKLLRKDLLAVLWIYGHCPVDLSSKFRKHNKKVDVFTEKKMVLVLPSSFQGGHCKDFFPCINIQCIPFVVFYFVFLFFIAVLYKLISQVADFLAKKSCRLLPLLFPPASLLCILIQIS